MEDIIDLIATDASASDVTDKIKDALYAKSAERIETLKPDIANSFFGASEEEPTEQEEE